MKFSAGTGVFRHVVAVSPGVVACKMCSHVVRGFPKEGSNCECVRVQFRKTNVTSLSSKPTPPT